MEGSGPVQIIRIRQRRKQCGMRIHVDPDPEHWNVLFLLMNVMFKGLVATFHSFWVSSVCLVSQMGCM
jgi:hypothetical protein